MTGAALDPILAAAHRYFADHAAVRSRFHTRMRTLWAGSYRGLPWWRDGTWFQPRRSGSMEQDVLWAGTELTARGRIVLDPATLGGQVVVDLAISPDGRHVAYAAARPGSEWYTWRIRAVDRGADLADRSRPARFTAAIWLPDSSGLRYTGAIGDRSGPTGLLCHRLGTPAGDDEVLFAAPDAAWSFDRIVDARADLLLVQAHDGRANRVFARATRATRPTREAGWREITPDDRNDWRLIGHHADRVLLLSDAKDELRTVETMAADAGPAPTETVTGGTEGPIEWATLVGDHLVVVENGPRGQRLRGVDLTTGGGRSAALPEFGSIERVRAADRGGSVLVSFTSYTTPATTYRVDLRTGETLLIDPVAAAGQPHYAGLRTICREVPAVDGARIPLYIVAAREAFDESGESLRAPQPMVLSVYGGFGESQRPTFRWVWLAWLEAGGAVAFGGVRGGADRGGEWHRSATGTGKQRTFDDVVACARYLTREGFSRPPGPVVHGHSNGGLSAAASFLQHPDAFSGLAVENALLDMVHYEELDRHGLWTAEFGSAGEAAVRSALHAYSPVEAVRDGAAYPPVFVSAGHADELVSPEHSYRFAARLHRSAPATPLVLRIDPEAGHGRSATISQLCTARGDLLAFLAVTLKLAR